MARLAFSLFALVAIIGLSIGCGGTDEVTGDARTHVTITIEPSQPFAQEPAVLTVSVRSSRSGVRQVAIDFTGDGTWDEAQDFDAPSATATFVYVYPSQGVFTVRAVARDGDDAPTEATLSVTVAASRLVPVSYVLLGHSADGGICAAHGPPSECAGCSRQLGADWTSAVRRPLGTFPHRASISISQNFEQWPYANGQDVLYSCQFTLRFVAGVPPNEVPFNLGTCTTTSIERPVRLTCNIALSGVVP